MSVVAPAGAAVLSGDLRVLLSADAPLVSPPDVVAAATNTINAGTAQVVVAVAEHGDGSVTAWVEGPLICGRCRHDNATARCAAGTIGATCCGEPLAVPRRRIPAGPAAAVAAAADAAVQALAAEHGLYLVSLAAAEAAARDEVAEHVVGALRKPLASGNEGDPHLRRLVTLVQRPKWADEWQWANLGAALLRSAGAPTYSHAGYQGAGVVEDLGVPIRASLAKIEAGPGGWVVRCQSASGRAGESGAWRSPPPPVATETPVPTAVATAFDCLVRTGHIPDPQPERRQRPALRQRVGFYLPEQGADVDGVWCTPLPDGGVAAEYAGGLPVVCPAPVPCARRCGHRHGRVGNIVARVGVDSGGCRRRRRGSVGLRLDTDIRVGLMTTTLTAETGAGEWFDTGPPETLTALLDGSVRSVEFAQGVGASTSPRRAVWAARDGGRTVVVAPARLPCGCDTTSLPTWDSERACFVAACGPHGDVAVAARSLPLLALFDDPDGPSPQTYIAAAAFGVLCADPATSIAVPNADTPVGPGVIVDVATPAAPAAAAVLSPDGCTAAVWMREGQVCGCSAGNTIFGAADCVRWEWSDDRWVAQAGQPCGGDGPVHDRPRMSRVLVGGTARPVTVRELAKVALGEWATTQVERQVHLVMARAAAVSTVAEHAAAVVGGVADPAGDAWRMLRSALPDADGAWAVEVAYNDGTVSGLHTEFVALPPECGDALAALSAVGIDV